MNNSDVLGDNGQLAIIVQLNSAPDHAARADILLHCPKIIMLKYRAAFERACKTSGLQMGEDYIDAWSTALNANCGSSGAIPKHLQQSIMETTQQLRILSGDTQEKAIS